MNNTKQVIPNTLKNFFKEVLFFLEPEDELDFAFFAIFYKNKRRRIVTLVNERQK